MNEAAIFNSKTLFMQLIMLALAIVLLAAFGGKELNENKDPKITRSIEIEKSQEEKPNVTAGYEEDNCDFSVFDCINGITGIQ
jgi:hypothetical protein